MMIDYTLPLDQLPDPLPIKPLTRPFDVTITPLGSKSITCRAYVLAALGQGESKLIRPLRADDTELLLKALCTLGAEARWEGEDVYIKGVGGRFPRGGSLYLGDGGTPTRFMIACACLAAEPVTVDGSKRMRDRPIAEGVAMLRQLGATIEYIQAEGRLPVRVTPSDTFVGGEIEVGQTQSSQFISAAMLISAWLPHGLTLKLTTPPTSWPYIDLTGRMMWDWVCGFDMPEDWESASGSAPKVMELSARRYRGRTFAIEPDASSAMYWFAAAMVGQSRTTMPFAVLQTLQPDARALLSLATAGCELEIDLDRSTSVQAIENIAGMPDENCAEFPDAAMMLAVVAACARQQSRLTGLQTLRVKETDRIAALANELRKVGCIVETGDDWIEITPAPARAASHPPAEPGAKSERADPIVIETYNDHRMAMAFAVLGLAAPRSTGGRRLAIRKPACVAKSYPTFWKDFAKLYQ